jgi:hypothetical protein
VQCRAQFAARCQPACLAVLLLFLATGTMRAREHDSGPQPAVRIPVQPLGYRPPGRLYLLARYSSSSLDFLDSNHLLLTFRRPRLLVRAQGSGGLEQVIQADVLELPTGKVVAEDQWLMHDRERYVWRLADNKVLLRVGSHLYEADSNLHLKPLYESPTELEAVDTSPDGKLLVVESELEKHTPEEHQRLAEHAAQVGGQPPAEDVQIRMMRIDEPKLMLSARSDAAGELPATVEGFFDHERVKEDMWNVRFHPYEKPEPTGGDIITQFESACEPSEKVLNKQSVLILSCLPGHDDRFVAAYSLDRRKLWDGRWQSNFTWPAFRISQDGASVAISWLAINHSVPATTSSIDDDEVQSQVLSVLDSRTGSLRLAVLLKPIVSAGGNFALSADGNRLAVLNQGAIEVYNLPTPPPPAIERPQSKEGQSNTPAF